MPAKKEVKSCCEVCSETGHGHHFGVVACRACAAFFRRTAANDLKYECQHGGHCTIDKSISRMCRKCRHDKCLKVGMKPDTIQLHRDTFRGTPRKKQELEIGQSLPSTSAPTPKPVATMRSTAKEMLMTRVSQIFHNALFQCNQGQLPGLLHEMVRGYKELQNSRRNIYSTLKMASPVGGETEAEETARIVANCGIFVRIVFSEVELAAHMLTHNGPFMALPPKERMLLFEHFWPLFLRLERTYATYLELGSDINDNRIILFDGTIVGGGTTLAGFKRICRLSEEELKNLFQPSKELTVHYLETSLKLLKPTEVEFIAMCIHMLWTAPNLEDVSVDTLETAREVRAKIYSELCHYYTEVASVQVYAPRIAELLYIVAAAENTVERGKEDVLLIKIFDLAAVDSKVIELLT